MQQGGTNNGDFGNRRLAPTSQLPVQENSLENRALSKAFDEDSDSELPILSSGNSEDDYSVVNSPIVPEAGQSDVPRPDYEQETEDTAPDIESEEDEDPIDIYTSGGAQTATRLDITTAGDIVDPEDTEDNSTAITAVPSSPIYSLNLPDPKMLRASFVYRYFTKDETTDEYNQNVYTANSFKTKYGDPRYIKLEFDEINTMASDDTMGPLLTNRINDILSEENLLKITSELMLQSNGYTKLTSEILTMQNFVQNASGGTATNTVDAFFSGASSPANVELFNKLLPDIALPVPTYLNTSTARPTIESADTISKASLQTFVATDFVYDIGEAAALNPFSIHGVNFSQDLDTLKVAQVRQRKVVSPLLFNLDEYNMLVDPIVLNDDPVNGDLQGISVIGYIIFKHDITSGVSIAKPSIAIVNRTESEFKDYNVKYGAKYKYNIHPLCILRYKEYEGDDAENILIIGTQSKTAEISAIETVPPPPIEAIQFDWDGVKLNMRWGMPMGQINDSGGPIGDIKGYQVFSRPNTNTPFKLKRMLMFYDGIEPFKTIENVGGLVTSYNYPVSNYAVNIEPDSEQIFAMCVIDAHGNSSNLSPQYKVRLDSYRNVIVVEFVSFKGAPKQYPNFMMSDKIFLDAIKASNVKKMSIFYKPDVTDISTSADDNVGFPITNHKGPTTNGTPSSPSYRLQIINTNTQSGNILDIFLPNSN